MKICEHCERKVHAKGLCMKHYQAAHYLANRAHEPRKVMTPEERLESQRAARDRYHAKNPGANSAAAKKWRDAHPEQRAVRAARQLRYAAENREQERERAARWRSDNPDRDAASRRSYYERNSEEVKARNYAYRRANPERYRMYQRDYKAAKRAGGGRLSRGCIPRLLILQRGLCVACRCDLSVSGYHVDHVVAIANGGQHCDENVQLLCPTCNRRKSARDFTDFIALMEAERA